jgi:ABC-2 type transport system ATP-binding protein
MPEQESFLPGMTAVRFVRLMGELSGLPWRRSLERAHEALFLVGLGEARYRTVETYSLGMKQMAKLAQALVHGPRLLFLDEPTNGLDPAGRRRMIELIQEIRDSGEARIILSSHLLRDVEECCDEVLVLKEGALSAVESLREPAEGGRLLELELKGAEEAFIGALVELGCTCAPQGKRKVKVILEEGLELRELFRVANEHGTQIRRLQRQQSSLEDIFLQAVEG